MVPLGTTIGSYVFLLWPPINVCTFIKKLGDWNTCEKLSNLLSYCKRKRETNQFKYVQCPKGSTIGEYTFSRASFVHIDTWTSNQLISKSLDRSCHILLKCCTLGNKIYQTKEDITLFWFLLNAFKNTKINI